MANPPGWAVLAREKLVASLDPSTVPATGPVIWPSGDSGAPPATSTSPALREPMRQWCVGVSCSTVRG